jgi:hypothetical protein
MAEWLRENPWRQGHVLTKDCAAELGLKHSENATDTVVVVISHDCDLAQDQAVEKFCEVIIGREIDGKDLDGNCANAKNVRRLHMEFSAGSEKITVELEANQKLLVDKARLASYQPSDVARLSANEKTILRSWLAARYNRASFPDEFERRLTKGAKKAYEKLVKIFKATGDDLIAIFFDVDKGREIDRDGPDDPYELVIYVLYSVEKDPDKAKAVATGAVEAIRTIFEKEFFVGEKWRNIELASCDAISEAAMTVRMSRQMNRWHIDYMSLRENQPVIGN